MKITPKDSVDALRLMRKHEDVLLEPDDPDETKEQVQGIVAAYLSEKREGHTELEFLDWYETADVTAFGDDGEAPDPTA